MIEELKNFKVKRVSPQESKSVALSEYHSLEEHFEHAKKVLIGIGREWRMEGREEAPKLRMNQAYEALGQLVKGKDYFVITTNTDGAIYQFELDNRRIVAPCGNETWRQCSKACTKDIWEPGEIPDDICPHCGAPLTGNTIKAEVYIEEGYLPQWRKYTEWLAGTMNQPLLILELGEGFENPGVIRWPFEKTITYNQKSFLYRVNETFAQLAEGMKDRAASISENSVEWVLCNGKTCVKMLKNEEKEKENHDGNR